MVRLRRSSIARDSIGALALALDAKDPASRHHADRVARYAQAVGARLDLDARRLERLVAAALLHDIGVLGVPDALLQRDDELHPHELDIVREHAVIGARILEAAGLHEIAPWVRHHHERIDGRGYPDKLAGEAIPLESRIIGVVEALETITASRYQRQRRASAIDELDDHKGTQFDAAVTDALIQLIVSGDLEGLEDPPLLRFTDYCRLHDPEWVVTHGGARRRLSSMPG